LEVGLHELGRHEKGHSREHVEQVVAHARLLGGSVGVHEEDCVLDSGLVKVELWLLSDLVKVLDYSRTLSRSVLVD